MSAKEDTRVTYGARCTWWGSIHDVGRRKTGSGYELPCCPCCGGPLFELPDEASWFASVDKHERAGHPGYRALIEWLRGRCFPSMDAARTAREREPQLTTFMVLIEPWSVYVKDADFFARQGGHEAEWGRRWERVEAGSIYEARREGVRRGKARGVIPAGTEWIAGDYVGDIKP